MYKSETFANVGELVDFLNDVLVSSEHHNPETKITGLNGLTLVINDGEGDNTVTFSDTEDGLYPSEIVDQINSIINVAELRNYNRGYVVVALTSGTVKGTGTANSLLGFPVTDKTIGLGAIDSSNIIVIGQAADFRIFLVYES